MFVALRGTIDSGKSWIARAGITATVMSRNGGDYYLPGRQQHFTDVIEIMYHADQDSPDTYILRFFANGYGLIQERQIVTTQTEIASLQLLSWESN